MFDDPIKIFIKGRNESACIVIRYNSIIQAIPNLSNNQCEWKALVMAMEYILDHRIPKACIFTDSSLLLKQLSAKTENVLGTFSNNRVKSKKLHPIYREWNVFKNLLYDRDIFYIHVSPQDNPARCYI